MARPRDVVAKLAGDVPRLLLNHDACRLRLGLSRDRYELA